MTIRIYPSRMPGEPLETHEHKPTTLRMWLVINVPNYHDRDLSDHPISIELNGVPISPMLWGETDIQSGDDVRIYPVPYATGIEIASWIAVGIAAASAAYSIYMISSMDKGGFESPSNGDQLELNPAKANTAKLGDPIREVFGKYRIYPDYLCQPVSRFVDERSFITSMFVCLSEGELEIHKEDICVGLTPASSFGDDVTWTIYPPGADVGSDARTENWYNSTEVGNTTSGTAGLDLNATAPKDDDTTAPAILFSGNTLTLLGSDQDDNDVLPDTWTTGTILTIEAPDAFIVQLSGGRDEIYGDMKELAPSVGMAVTLGFEGVDYDLVIETYTPYKAAVPGVGGSPATISGSAHPSVFDFTAQTESFTLFWSGLTFPVALVANYLNLSGVVSSITDQLTGSGLIAFADEGRISIRESSSPYAGGSIGYSSLPEDLFGSPTSIIGIPSEGGSAAVPAHITLKYDSGTPFTGIPDGPQRLSIGLRENKYRITAIDALTITVERLIIGEDEAGNSTTTVDSTWPGFSERTLLDFSVSGVSDDELWMGPFLACPDGETTDQIEININFQNGLIKYDNKGHKKDTTVDLRLAYRDTLKSDGWIETDFSYTNRTEDQIGYTRAFTVPAGQYEIKMRRLDAVDGGSSRDQVYWQALRARLKARPSSYRNITTMALTIKTGNKLASQSDRRVNVTAARKYAPGYASRSISGALNLVLSSVGVSAAEIDTASINALETQYWTPRGEYFDFAADSDDTSALEMLQKICTAGMGYFYLSGGLYSAGREGVKSWVGVVTPQEMTESLEVQFKAPSPDDYDGVDVTYIDDVSWAEETVQCRIPGNPTPRKVESYQLDGVTDPDRAYRIGMRRLQGYLLQRLTFQIKTEMDMLCYEYGDRLILTDDIPGGDTTSCLIEDASNDDGVITITVTEPLNWSVTNPRCLIRYQDGSASALITPTKVSEYVAAIPASAVNFDEWIIGDPYIEPPRFILCSSERVGYDSIVNNIDPDSDGTCQSTAKQYSPDLYKYDDAIYQSQ
ncbi:host specificity factor TipJ family phage tail protein [Lelliottia sp. V89_10]|uniref:host specificity factor TipJ family phage tail protein n=1 Tax=Lelliottia wanjuensis TaxID=3050585 RepID=UPI00249DD44C|nr:MULTISPECIES: host specificity factor TipJ family phage tail protein [unclassified Lelliottia]MDI3359787.1 host specificity factor TipJ family phage tail protein [Lelliottia sp. V89_13]MDK9548745.1 host specificity factor TipJ family phage tail protein [Lelliottia sp. V89_5]MDK9597377.1 host specificity factor TipJ family phage tail protein [Lelliottia sp. V89_10]